MSPADVDRWREAGVCAGRLEAGVSDEDLFADDDVMVEAFRLTPGE